MELCSNYYTIPALQHQGYSLTTCLVQSWTFKMGDGLIPGYTPTNLCLQELLGIQNVSGCLERADRLTNIWKKIEFSGLVYRNSNLLKNQLFFIISLPKSNWFFLTPLFGPLYSDQYKPWLLHENSKFRSMHLWHGWILVNKIVWCNQTFLEEDWANPPYSYFVWFGLVWLVWFGLVWLFRVSYFFPTELLLSQPQLNSNLNTT